MDKILHIWTILVQSNTFNFIIFALLIAWILKKVNAKDAINSLQVKIVEKIEQAKSAKTQAIQELKEAEKSLENLTVELGKIISDTKFSAETIAKKIVEEAKESALNIEKNAQKLLEAEEKKVVSTLTQRTAKASVELAKSKILSALEKDGFLHQKYINDSVEQLERLSF